MCAVPGPEHPPVTVIYFFEGPRYLPGSVPKTTKTQ